MRFERVNQLAESGRLAVKVEMKKKKKKESYTCLFTWRAFKPGSQETRVDMHVKTRGKRAGRRLTSSTFDQKKRVRTRCKLPILSSACLVYLLKSNTINHSWVPTKKEIEVEKQIYHHPPAG